MILLTFSNIDSIGITIKLFASFVNNIAPPTNTIITNVVRAIPNIEFKS